MRTLSEADSESLQHLYGQISALASQTEQDELAIKEALIAALEKGQTRSALRILKEWRGKPARDVVNMYLEAGDGRSG